jgi:hypothetical protein
MSRVRTIKEVRGRWADARRAVYLLQEEIARSYRKDQAGAEFMRKEVLEPMKMLLDAIDAPISEGEDLDFAMSLAGLNNFNASTFKRKMEAFLPHYTRYMAEQGIDVQLVERRRVIAQLVPPIENESWPYIERRRQQA